MNGLLILMASNLIIAMASNLIAILIMMSSLSTFFPYVGSPWTDEVTNPHTAVDLPTSLVMARFISQAPMKRYEKKWPKKKPLRLASGQCVTRN